MSPTLLDRVRSLPKPAFSAIAPAQDLPAVEERLQLDGFVILDTGARLAVLSDPESACGVVVLYRGDDVLVERALSLQGIDITRATVNMLRRAEALDRPSTQCFTPRVRFNMGFHDGTKAAAAGWFNLAADHPEWVRDHRDHVYVHGYRLGHDVMEAGGPRPSTSTAAWVEFRRECQQVAADGVGVVRGLVPVTTVLADEVLRDPSPH